MFAPSPSWRFASMRDPCDPGGVETRATAQNRRTFSIGTAGTADRGRTLERMGQRLVAREE